MHSSQLPAQKLPLTKGHTVNGMVKRLSMERFSPPPTITGPAFSYIRPNEGITYAQLELQDEPQHTRTTLPRREYNRSPIREYRSPVREMRSPSRDIFTPDRELVTTTVVNRSISKPAQDETDFIGTSQRNNYSPSYNTNNGTTTIHIGGSFSPSPWQMLSPRNLSDEDEGLGLETRKYYEDELHQSKRSKSPAEPPIIPKIRSITPPRENGFHSTTERYHTPSRDINPNDDMGYRRARLESRILTRRFGDSGTLERNGYHNSRENSHERHLEDRENYNPKRYLSPEREIVRDSYEPMRYHKPEVKEILNKYSPERSHLDIISPSTAINTTSTALPNSTMEKTSRYKHTKYYDDGHGGVKEVYERETQFDTDGKPHVRETRHRERLDSYTGKVIRESSPLMEPQRHRERLDSYTKNGRDSSPSLLETRHRERLDSFTHTKGTRDSSPLMERQLITDYEPKSFDSQFTTTDQYRSSPENMKRYDLNSDRGVNNGRLSSEDRWHSSLKRDKLQQRSFDKGDSGIENDFRKESFNGDLVTRWRKPTTDDNIKSCESFLKKERRYCEHERPQKRSENYVYRERSIDDGSHFDPHLDKYPSSSGSTTLKRRDQQSQTVQAHHDMEKTNTSTLKRSKKLGGFEKVKQLFTGSSADKKDPERKSVSSSTSSSAGTQQTVKPKDKDKYMVKEEEIRSRYRVNGVVTNGSSSSGGGGGVGVATQTSETLREPKATDISMRRRLSTPKASPLLLKRTSSDKNRKESPLAKPEKTSWFKSLDRRAKSKSKEKLNSSAETSSLKRTKHKETSQAPPAATKNLRFFGDTDLDSNPPTISKGSSTLHKSRPHISSNLNRSQKYSQSAYHIDRIRSDSPQRDDYRHSLASGSKSLGFTPTTTGNATTGSTSNLVTTATQRHKSNSMHNLDNQGNDEVDFRRRRHYSRSRELDHISESGSETEDQETKLRPGLMAARTLSRDRLDRTTRYDEHSYRRSNDRPISSTPNGNETSSSNQQQQEQQQQQHQPRRTQPYLMGPPKPARSAERRAMSYSRERDRFPAESSGTEGESSLHSQRSVVYLHATTVGAIPQPYQLRRRSISRDDLRSHKSKTSSAANQPLQPMTRTVSRSVSMLAPWKPKLISEGYEINYSQEQNKTMATLPRKPPMHGGSSTMTRTSRKSEPMSTRNGGTSRRHLDYMKDDQSSLRNSSTTSASKSGLSTNLHRKK
ncbi:bloated isoform X2 [Musca autumnalis]